MPPRGHKRKSESVASEMDDAPNMATATSACQKIATKSGSAEESPRKRQKTGVTAAQKQALIDNLQLEVTERARKLRAQYSLQAQGLRTRIEIRVNRIPMALRKLKMGDLLQKHASNQQKPTAPRQTTVNSSTVRSAAPPVPEKDYHAVRPPMSRPESSPRAAVSRPVKRLSDQLAGGDKENQDALLDNPKKRQRAGNASAATHTTQSSQVLSPASSNLRLNPRERGAPSPAHAPSSPSPVKSIISRPMSPTKQSTGLISSMVEKARSTRAATTRKPTASSIASSAAGGTSRAHAKTTTAASASRATEAEVSRHARTVSESSDASTSTVVRKVGRPPGSTAASSGARKTTGTMSSSTAKKSMMGSMKKSVASASTKKAPAVKAAPATAAAATTRSGRILRKRE